MFDGILTQATRAKSLPGTSRIAAIRKLMNRVPVHNKDSVSRAATICSFKDFNIHPCALSFVCTGKALPVEGDSIEHEGGGEPVEEHHQGLDPQPETFSQL